MLLFKTAQSIYYIFETFFKKAWPPEMNGLSIPDNDSHSICSSSSVSVQVFMKPIKIGNRIVLKVLVDLLG